MNPQKIHDTIIIGSGIGGIAAAALLVKNGIKPLILEKNNTPGGIMARYTENGYTIDRGSHMIANGKKGALGKLLRELNLSDDLFLTHKIPSESVGLLSCKLPQQRRQLLSFGISLLKSLNVPKKQYFSLLKLVKKILFISQKEIETIWDDQTLEQFLNQYINHPPLYFLFSFLMSIFFVLPPWEVSAGESLHTLGPFIRNYNLSYIKGGMFHYIKTLLNYVEDAGGTCLTDCHIIAIEHFSEGFKLTAQSGEIFFAQHVIANLAPGDLLNILKTPETEQLKKYKNRVHNIKPAYNAFQVKMGLKKKVFDSGSFIGTLSLSDQDLFDYSVEDVKIIADTIQQGEPGELLSIYAPIPSNFEPDLAPKGKQLIVASIYGPIKSLSLEQIDRWQAAIKDGFRRLIPDFDQLVDFYHFEPITSVANWMGKSNLGAIGNGQYPGQVGKSRLPVTTPIPNLYLCGDGAGGRGIGVELSVNSAQEAVTARLNNR